VNYRMYRTIFTHVIKKNHKTRALPLYFELEEREKELLRDQKGYKVCLYVCTDPDVRDKTYQIALPPQIEFHILGNVLTEEVCIAEYVFKYYILKWV
jgi:hypothetical protein